MIQPLGGHVRFPVLRNARQVYFRDTSGISRSAGVSAYGMSAATQPERDVLRGTCCTSTGR
jgi:hypothetical protein